VLASDGHANTRSPNATGPARGTLSRGPRPSACGDRQVTQSPRPQRSRTITGRGSDDVTALDKRIIEHLQEDGRRPYTQIAADLGVSEAAVRARTNRLIERGILQVVGVTDPLKLGFHQMAMIGIRCESSKLIEVAEHLAAMPEVDYVVITAGSYDLLIETVCEDNDALLVFLADRLRAIDGVRDTETFVYLRLVKQTYQYGTR
jgi:Lrp/AsnC family transcriptional regulator for asnA, asnC and gidA